MTQEEIEKLDTLIMYRVMQIFYELPQMLAQKNGLYDEYQIINKIGEIKRELLTPTDKGS